MPYEIIVPEDDDEYNPLDDREILIINSPLSLSNHPHEACLGMEVIGISPVAMIPNYCNVDKGLAHCVDSSTQCHMEGGYTNSTVVVRVSPKTPGLFVLISADVLSGIEDRKELDGHQKPEAFWGAYAMASQQHDHQCFLVLPDKATWCLSSYLSGYTADG